MTNDFRESILVWQRTQAEDQCSDIFPRLIATSLLHSNSVFLLLVKVAVRDGWSDRW